jgi:hypothetical protein
MMSDGFTKGGIVPAGEMTEETRQRLSYMEAFALHGLVIVRPDGKPMTSQEVVEAIKRIAANSPFRAVNDE